MEDVARDIVTFIKWALILIPVLGLLALGLAIALIVVLL